jgi:hypothetical protein
VISMPKRGLRWLVLGVLLGLAGPAAAGGAKQFVGGDGGKVVFPKQALRAPATPVYGRNGQQPAVGLAGHRFPTSGFGNGSVDIRFEVGERGRIHATASERFPGLKKLVRTILKDPALATHIQERFSQQWTPFVQLNVSHDGTIHSVWTHARGQVPYVGQSQRSPGVDPAR